LAVPNDTKRPAAIRVNASFLISASPFVDRPCGLAGLCKNDTSQRDFVRKQELIQEISTTFDLRPRASVMIFDSSAR